MRPRRWRGQLRWVGLSLAAVCACRPLPTAEEFAYVDAAGADAAEVAGPRCGDGACDGEETVDLCPADCAGANRHLAQACTTPGATAGCDHGYVCVARAAEGGGAVCVADFATWPPLPIGHPEGSFASDAESSLDLTTGLRWTHQVSGALRDFDAALYCAQQKADGARDWRLPTRAELTSLVDFNRDGLMSSAPAFAWNPDTYCHWSASRAADGWGSWVVNLWGGKSMTYGDTYTCVVRCVRGQPSAPQLRQGLPRYAEVAEGQAVLDRQTGLRWRKAPPDKLHTFTDAKAYCQSLRLQEPGSGWRLPSIRELLELVDLRRSEPSLAPPLQMPAGGEARFYAASTVVPHVEPWGVDFASGALFGDPSAPTLLRHTRCVQ